MIGAAAYKSNYQIIKRWVMKATERFSVLLIKGQGEMQFALTSGKNFTDAG